MEEVFAYLHQHPELSWQEERTSLYIQKLVTDTDCTITTFANSPGFVVEIGSGKPVIGIRADMDALWQEVDGITKANHSCGHDAHMTMVIGTLWVLVEKMKQTSLKGTFRFIFQPAEETGEGALHVVEQGVIDEIDFLYGMHVRPKDELANGYYAPAIQHGAARFIEGEIIGVDAHGARPHLTANAIEVGTEFFQHVNHIHLNPMVPYSAKMTKFHAGSKNTNIIPGKASFSLDVRAQTNEVMEALTEKIYRIGDMLATYHHVSIDLKIQSEIAAAVLNEEAMAYMEKAIVKVAGKDKLRPVITTSGGDDFHFYTIKRPDVKATMLAIGCDLVPGLHHPNMTFDHQVIPVAVEILVNTLWETAMNLQR